MKLSALIASVGDENVNAQLLAESLHGNQKSKGGMSIITFVTDQISLLDLISGQGSKIGFVIWLPREAVEKAIAENKQRKEAV